MRERLFSVSIDYRVGGKGRVLTRTWIVSAFDEEDALQDCREVLDKKLKPLKAKADISSIRTHRIQSGMCEIEGSIIL